MFVIEKLVELVDVEISLLISKAKLNLCDSEDDLDDASYAYKIAFECGVIFQTILFELYDEYDECDEISPSPLLNEVIVSIDAISLTLSPYLKRGFDCGVGDVKIDRW